MQKKYAKFNLKDIGEIIIGSVIMGFPAASTGEIWDLGETLPLYLAIIIAVISISFIGFFVHTHYHSGTEVATKREFYLRTISVYLITIIICSSLLALLSQFPIFSDPVVAIKRCIIVSLPASLAATAVDSFE